MRCPKGQVTGQIQVQHLAVAAGRRQNGPQRLPVSGLGAGLLPQFPPGRSQRVLAGLPLSGGDLQQRPAKHIAVLLHQHGAVLVIQRQDPHAAGVAYHLPCGGIAIGQGHGIHLHVDDAAMVDLPAGEQLFGQVHSDILLAFFLQYTTTEAVCQEGFSISSVAHISGL